MNDSLLRLHRDVIAALCSGCVLADTFATAAPGDPDDIGSSDAPGPTVDDLVEGAIRAVVPAVIGSEDRAELRALLYDMLQSDPELARRAARLSRRKELT